MAEFVWLTPAARLVLLGLVDNQLHAYAGLRKQAPHLFDVPDTDDRVKQLRCAREELRGLVRDGNNGG